MGDGEAGELPDDDAPCGVDGDAPDSDGGDIAGCVEHCAEAGGDSQSDFDSVDMCVASDVVSDASVDVEDPVVPPPDPLDPPEPSPTPDPLADPPLLSAREYAELAHVDGLGNVRCTALPYDGSIIAKITQSPWFVEPAKQQAAIRCHLHQSKGSMCVKRRLYSDLQMLEWLVHSAHLPVATTKTDLEMVGDQQINHWKELRST